MATSHDSYGINVVAAVSSYFNSTGMYFGMDSESIAAGMLSFPAPTRPLSVNCYQSGIHVNAVLRRSLRLDVKRCEDQSGAQYWRVVPFRAQVHAILGLRLRAVPIELPSNSHMR